MTTTDSDTKQPFLPPRWFIRSAWAFHRGLFRISGGRMGLRPEGPGKYGMLRLTVTGRRTGQDRSVILGYYEDGESYVTMAMNGWGDPEPAWWLNLQANPVAKAELDDRTITVRGRAAEGEERDRLWQRWREIDDNLDSYAARRSRETAVVVLEPITEAG